MSIDLKGKLAGNPEKTEIDTRFKVSDDAVINFGKGVQITDEDDEVKKYTTNGYFLGVALESNEKIGTDDTRDYDKYDTIKILKKGIVYVELDDDVDLDIDGPAVGINPSSGDFGTSDAYDTIYGAEFLESGSAGDEIRMRLNFPSQQANA